jgi:hypothetical protein
VRTYGKHLVIAFSGGLYEMLHTTALAVGSQPTADLALAHMKDYAPFIVALTDEVPRLLVRELSDEGKIAAASSAADQAARNARAAWTEAAAQAGLVSL